MWASNSCRTTYSLSIYVVNVLVTVCNKSNRESLVKSRGSNVVVESKVAKRRNIVCLCSCTSTAHEHEQTLVSGTNQIKRESRSSQIELSEFWFYGRTIADRRRRKRTVDWPLIPDTLQTTSASSSNEKELCSKFTASSCYIIKRERCRFLNVLELFTTIEERTINRQRSAHLRRENSRLSKTHRAKPLGETQN